MLRLSIDLDVKTRDIVTERDVKTGEIFPVLVMIEEDGQEPISTEFDTLIVELLFNDIDEIISVDPAQRPVAGMLATHSQKTIDAFSRERVKPVDVRKLPVAVFDRELLAPEGTQLTLRLPTGDPIGRYKNSTGRAGLVDFSTPFRLSPEDGPITVALGKATAGLKAVRSGMSHIVPVGTALLEGNVIPMNSVVSTVTVVG